MESISSIVFGIAGNRSCGSSTFTFLGKLMDRLGLGNPRVPFVTSAARTSGQTSSRYELAP